MQTNYKNTQNSNKSYIDKFNNLFSVNGGISEKILEEQKKEFGFTIYLLHNLNIFKAIKLGIENSRNIIEKQRNIFQIPHTYIFGGLFLGFILLLIQSSFLFLPIFFLIIYFFSIRNILKIISEKMLLFKKSRVFFNLSLEEAIKINNDFLKVQPYKIKPQLWKSQNGKTMDGNSFKGRTFLFLFSQPFIFGHLHIFGGIPFSILGIYDFIIFLIVYGLFEKIIIFLSILYYSIYFKLLDKYPQYFSIEDKKNDFYLDLYKLGYESIKDISLLENEVNNFKNGIINKNLGQGFTSSILGVNNILNLISNNEEFLQNNGTFKMFLKNLVNEIIDSYLKIFEYLISKIQNFESANNGISEEYKAFYDILVNQNLTNKIKELNNLKNKINSLKIT